MYVCRNSVLVRRLLGIRAGAEMTTITRLDCSIIPPPADIPAAFPLLGRVDISPVIPAQVGIQARLPQFCPRPTPF